MYRKPLPFSDLTTREFDAIVRRARDERNHGIADAVAWLGRRIAAIVTGRPAGMRATPRRARSEAVR